MGFSTAYLLSSKGQALLNFPEVWKHIVFEAGVKNIPNNVSPVYGYLLDQNGHSIRSRRFSPRNFVANV